MTATAGERIFVGAFAIIAAESASAPAQTVTMCAPALHLSFSFCFTIGRDNFRL
jgi:hypothetical protein